MEEKIEKLEKEIKFLKQRNKQVELNKSWEISWTRRALIALFTYLTIAVYLFIVVHINPLINAIVPTVGFTLSTLSLPYFKRWWASHIYNK